MRRLNRGFRKLGIPFLGVPRIQGLEYFGLYIGVPLSRETTKCAPYLGCKKPLVSRPHTADPFVQKKGQRPFRSKAIPTQRDELHHAEFAFAFWFRGIYLFLQLMSNGEP